MIVYAAAGALGLAILAAILLTVISSKKRKKSAAMAALQPAVTAKGLPTGAKVAMPAGAGKAAALVAGGDGDDAVMMNRKSIEQSIEEAESKNTVKNQIAEFADDKPELVAQLLKNWLKD